MSSQQIFYNTVKAVGDTETCDRLEEIQMGGRTAGEAETNETNLANLERKKKKFESTRQIFEKLK